MRDGVVHVVPEDRRLIRPGRPVDLSAVVTSSLGWAHARRVAEAVTTGWMFVPILLLYGVVYLCNAGAWMLIMADEPRRPSFWRLYMVTASGFALNFVTPVVNVGGEPFKIAAVAPWLPSSASRTRPKSPSW